MPMIRYAPALAPALIVLLLLAPLAACGPPAVLRGPPGAATMPAPALAAQGEPAPLPALVELTGEPRITLPIATEEGFTPTAAPRSGRAARP